VPALVVREGLDIVFNPKFTVPLLASCKTMTVLHGTEWFIHPHFYPKLDVLYVKAMMPLYMRKADIVISVSNRARDDVITHAKADPRKVKTLYSAPDERFRRVPDAETLQAVKKRYGLPERFILNVGRIHPGKNVRTMLRVYGQLSSRIPHKLVMAGPVEGRYRNELGPIREYGLEEHVILPGWVPQEDMPALYRLAELFLFPSTYESCPIALLEAMASGCPVVSSSTGGTPEIAGDAALLIDPGDEDGMGRAVYEVLTKEPLRRELIRRGYEQSERFSWKRYAREMLTLFETLHAEG
jgi:glycosyltransferase involved in cell wall biosynthesis